MDVRLAQKLGCKMEPIHLQPISVADGSELNADMFTENSLGDCRVLIFVLMCF